MRKNVNKCKGKGTSIARGTSMARPSLLSQLRFSRRTSSSPELHSCPNESFSRCGCRKAAWEMIVSDLTSAVTLFAYVRLQNDRAHCCMVKASTSNTSTSGLASLSIAWFVFFVAVPFKRSRISSKVKPSWNVSPTNKHVCKRNHLGTASKGTILCRIFLNLLLRSKMITLFLLWNP